MDWGEAQDFVHFGAVGGEHVDDCDYYILIAPQNVVGNTIMTGLGDMVWVVELTFQAAACGSAEPEVLISGRVRVRAVCMHLSGPIMCC